MLPSSLRRPSLLEALLPFLVVVSLLGLNLYWLGDRAGNGANQAALVAGTLLAWWLGIRRGVGWRPMWGAMRGHLEAILPTIYFLLVVGAMSAMWLLGGITPAVVYYGALWLTPSKFLVGGCLFAAFVSLVTGSSWATIGTVGVALLGIGKTLGLSDGLVAGAIISGAYFGDKLSPLSETTVMASSVAGVPLGRHIYTMLFTSLPSLLLSLCLFGWMGAARGGDQADFLVVVGDVQGELAALFHMSPWLFVVPVVVMVAIAVRVTPVSALLLGAALGAAVAFCLQPCHITGLDGGWGAGFVRLVKVAAGGVDLSAKPGSLLQDLLGAGGMVGMVPTVGLMLAAVLFGGALEGAGLLAALQPRRLGSVRGLVGAVVATCLFFNVVVADQYLAILLTGKLYRPIFEKRGIAAEYLSRTLEDGATVTSPLVPWNTCGAAQAGVLGVATLAYAPYCFFNWLNPLLSILLSAPRKERGGA